METRDPDCRDATLPLPIVSIVDDDPSMREGMRFVLEANGLLAATFDSGESFLTAAVAEGSACIILDIRMPRLNGFDVLRRLGDLRERPPVIFVSAHLDDSVERAAYGAGVAACIRKPFTDEALIQVVRLVLRR